MAPSVECCSIFEAVATVSPNRQYLHTHTKSRVQELGFGVSGLGVEGLGLSVSKNH